MPSTGSECRGSAAAPNDVECALDGEDRAGLALDAGDRRVARDCADAAVDRQRDRDRRSPVPRARGRDGWSASRSAQHLFMFADPDRPDDVRDAMASGELSWWAAPHLHWRYFRPLAAITHHAEFRAFDRGGEIWMHLHSVLWMARSRWWSLRCTAGCSARPGSPGSRRFSTRSTTATASRSAGSPTAAA